VAPQLDQLAFIQLLAILLWAIRLRVIMTLLILCFKALALLLVALLFSITYVLLLPQSNLFFILFSILACALRLPWDYEHYLLFFQPNFSLSLFLLLP